MTERPGEPTRESIDLDTVVEEIRAEARAKRESGAYPASLERELDALFEDLVPERLNEHDLGALIDRAERAALIDLHAPIDDERVLFSQVKRGVRKLVLWYMDYVVRQLSTFAGTTTRAVRVISERLETLEEHQEVLARRLPDAEIDHLDLLVPGVSGEPVWAAQAVELLRGRDGRVLHAEAGDGTVVRRLADGGVDAYGVDPRATDEAPDLRSANPIDHLRVVGDGALAGLVLSGFVDRAPPAGKVVAVQLAARVLEPGAPLVVATTSPSAWARVVPPPVVDLAPGRPFHPETWVLLLEHHGFERVEAQALDGSPEPEAFLVVGFRAS